jgi:hypothetical protein
MPFEPPQPGRLFHFKQGDFMSEGNGIDRVWRYKLVAESLGISTKTLQRLVEGDRVAEALKATIKRYIRMSDAEADVCALWVLLSWAIDKFSKAPRLAITSPTKGCG